MQQSINSSLLRFCVACVLINYFRVVDNRLSSSRSLHFSKSVQFAEDERAYKLLIVALLNTLFPFQTLVLLLLDAVRHDHIRLDFNAIDVLSY